MTEESHDRSTSDTFSNPEHEEPSPCKQRPRDRELLRRQSMPLLLPSIYEQQDFKRRVSLVKSGVESNMFEDSGNVSTDKLNRKRHSLDFRKPSGSVSIERLENSDDGSTSGLCDKMLSLSVDEVPGGKHTREREFLRTHSTAKIKKSLGEMEKEFSKSTLKEIERLRNLYQKGKCVDDSDLSDDGM